MSDTVARLPERLSTARLVIRRAAVEDARAMYQCYASDPEVTRYMTWSPHGSVDDTREYLEGVEARWESGEEALWFLVGADDRALRGGVGLRVLASHAHEVGYVLGRRFWGHGFMTEAVGAVVGSVFEDPTNWRVQATCHVDNGASRRVMEKVGFVHEGTLRRYQSLPAFGEPQDMDLLARVRSAD